MTNQTPVSESSGLSGFVSGLLLKYRFNIFIFCNSFANSMVVMFLSLYFKSLKIDESAIGNILGIYNLMLPMVILFFGMLSDKVSSKLMIGIGSAISVVYCISMLFARNVPALSVLVALSGLGYNLAFITANVLFLKTMSHEKKGGKLSSFVGFNSIGYAMGNMLSCILIKEMGWAPVCIFYMSIPFFIMALLMSRKLPDAPVEPFPIAQYVHDMKKLPVLCVSILSLSFGLHIGAETFALVRYMNEMINATGYQMALVFALSGLFLAGTARVCGKIMDITGKLFLLIIIGNILAAAFTVMNGFVRTYDLLLVARILHTAGDGALVFCIPMLLSLVFHSSRMGGNYGFNRSLNSIGACIGAFVSGYIAGRYNLSYTFVAAGVLQIVLVLPLWYLRKYIPHDVHKKDGHLVADDKPVN